MKGGTVEGWLFKTCQSLGAIQFRCFQKRFYRLHLASGELKVLDTLDGSLKQTVNLQQSITRVDDSLKQHFDAGALRISSNKMPDFHFPFGVLTASSIMVLWAETQMEMNQWVAAFSAQSLRAS